MEFLKKNWNNVLFIVCILILIIPQTRFPIQVFLNRMISFSPSEIEKNESKKIQDYDWDLVRLDATNLNFCQSEGKVILINYWATWCPPCVAEMPALQDLYLNFKDQVDFYFISNEKSVILQQFLNIKDYQLPVYRALAESPKNLTAHTLPTTYLISKSGEVRVHKIGVADWKNKKAYRILETLVAE